MRKTLCSQKAMTLSEVLVATLIVAVASALLASAILSTSRINQSADTAMQKFNVALSAVETKNATATSGTVTINGESVAVTFYQDGELTAYRRRDP